MTQNEKEFIKECLKQNGFDGFAAQVYEIGLSQAIQFGRTQREEEILAALPREQEYPNEGEYRRAPLDSNERAGDISIRNSTISQIRHLIRSQNKDL